MGSASYAKKCANYRWYAVMGSLRRVNNATMVTRPTVMAVPVIAHMNLWIVKDHGEVVSENVALNINMEQRDPAIWTHAPSIVKDRGVNV